jgi:hypothetical protein
MVGGGGTVVGGGMVGGGTGGIIVGPGGGAQVGMACCNTGGVCAGPGAAMGCGVGTDCTTCTSLAGPAVMTFVGVGQGDYVTETSYKYVGRGAGIFSMMAPKRSFLPQVLTVVAVVIVLIVGFLMWPENVTTTTTLPTTQLPTTQAPVVKGICEFWGDPHIKSFDGARLSFYGDGEFWVVKSAKIKIQGVYMGTKWTHGLAATSKIVVSGAFIGDKKIVVGSLETGPITVDGAPILSTFPSTYTSPAPFGFTINYNNQGQLVDKADHKPANSKIVHMDLLNGQVQIEVMRWDNYIDFKITMPKQTVQDGSCGNFNGNAADDTTDAIMQRIGARVADGDLLFAHRHTIDFTPEMQAMLTGDCTGAARIKAEAECRQELPAASAAVPTMMNSCLFDHCFGYNQHALRTAKTYD